MIKTSLAFAGCVVGICISKFGLMLMKLVHLNKEKDIGTEKEKTSRPVCCRGLWWLGFGFIMLGVALHFVTLPYTTLVLVAAGTVIGIAFNTVLSIKFLGEQFKWRYDLPALSMMAFGALVLTLSAVPEKSLMTYDEMIALLSQAQSIVFMISTLIMMVLAVVYTRIFIGHVRNFEEDLKGWAIFNHRKSASAE